uniref:PHD-type domain-containing protein n=1 Tax=Cacopsylla melanoneura TaxID=428564 RepID=A0A8D9DTN4_9HEMI
MGCFGCGGNLPKNGNCVHCYECGSDYHYKCTTLSEASYKSMGSKKKMNWKCQDCRKSQDSPKNKSRNRSLSESSEYDDVMDNVRSKGGKGKIKPKADKNHDDSSELFESSQEDGKVKDKKYGDTKTLENLFEKFEVKLWKKMDKKFSDMEECLEFTSGKIDEFSKTMKEIQKKLVMVEIENEKIKQENVELKTKVKSLEVGVEANAQLLSNSNKVEISGLPVSTVNAKDVVAKVLEKANGEKIEESGYEIEIKKQEKQTNVIVEFESKIQRDKLIKKKKAERTFKLGEIMNSSDDSLVYMNECLTPYYTKLFMEAKKIKRDKNYAFIWVRDGKILLKKTEQSKPMRLVCMEDLGKI